MTLIRRNPDVIGYRAMRTNGTYAYSDDLICDDERFRHFWEPLCEWSNARGPDEVVAFRSESIYGGVSFAENLTDVEHPDAWSPLCVWQSRSTMVVPGLDAGAWVPVSEVCGMLDARSHVLETHE